MEIWAATWVFQKQLNGNIYIDHVIENVVTPKMPINILKNDKNRILNALNAKNIGVKELSLYKRKNDIPIVLRIEFKIKLGL